VSPNVLAARYASPELVRLWSPESKVVLERRLWIAVLRAQRELGIPVPDGVIEDYERVAEDVDLASIAARERVTRHDVKARIEEFAALAGHEHIHKGLTSRDLTENVEQLQIRLSLEHVRDRTVAVLARLARRAAEHSELVLTGRILDGEEALAAGLVSDLFEPRELLAGAHALADRIAANDPLATQLTKRVLRAPRSEHPAAEREAQAQLFESPEKRRRMTEFLERRKAR